MPPRSQRHFLPDAAATAAAGTAIAPALVGGMIVTLSGELGSGKTTLARGMLRGLGWTGPVKSPSYALLEDYEVSSLYFYHFDLYRFDDSSEWETTGFSECFRDDAICVIEWPERVAALLPPVDLALALAYPDGEPLAHAPPNAISGIAGRILAASAHTARGERCLNALAGLLPRIAGEGSASASNAGAHSR